MLCEKCQQKQATVLIKQSINGVTTELHLCQECSTPQMTMAMPMPIELFNNLLGSFLTVAAEKQGVRGPKVQYDPCPTCGMTIEAFRTGGGKLGCAACYRVFAKELNAIFKNVQGNTRHEGKYPRRIGNHMFQEREADRMRGLMKKAIEEENFEEAARLRDQMRKLELPSAEPAAPPTEEA